MSLFVFFLFVVLGSIAPAQAAALEVATPFATSNQNPLVSIYGLPPAASATVLAPGMTGIELRADVASLCSREERNSETLLLDGETYRFTLVLKHGIGRRFEAGLEVPYVMHREGLLDNFIIGWHDFFNLPQGGRDEMPRRRLAYAYERNGELAVDLDDETEGLGDLRLSLGWQLLRPQGDNPHALALRTSIKLPTGNDERLLGSGSTDIAFRLSGSQTFRQGSLALFGAAGGLFMSEGDVLPDQQQHAVAFGTLGAGWKPLSDLALKVQIDGHTPFYRGSDLRGLSQSLQLSMGGSLALTQSLVLDVAVSEDIVVDSAPDVVFHFALRRTF